MDQSIEELLALVRRAQGGDRRALTALFERYYEPVRRIVRLRMGTKLRRRMESGDVVQEVFLSALTSFDRFEVRDESSFINWLAVIAQRRIADISDHLGAERRGDGLEVPLVFEDRSSAPGFDPSASVTLPPDGVQRNEQLRRIETAMAKLSDGQREFIILREYVGMSWSQIAETTGKPSPDAARMEHSKVMAKLAGLVQGGR